MAAMKMKAVAKGAKKMPPWMGAGKAAGGKPMVGVKAVAGKKPGKAMPFGKK